MASLSDVPGARQALQQIIDDSLGRDVWVGDIVEREQVTQGSEAAQDFGDLRLPELLVEKEADERLGCRIGRFLDLPKDCVALQAFREPRSEGLREDAVE
jgi:hypothetical protein